MDRRESLHGNLDACIKSALPLPLIDKYSHLNIQITVPIDLAPHPNDVSSWRDIVNLHRRIADKGSVEPSRLACPTYFTQRSHRAAEIICSCELKQSSKYSVRSDVIVIGSNWNSGCKRRTSFPSPFEPNGRKAKLLKYGCINLVLARSFLFV